MILRPCLRALPLRSRTPPYTLSPKFNRRSLSNVKDAPFPTYFQPPPPPPPPRRRYVRIGLYILIPFICGYSLMNRTIRYVTIDIVNLNLKDEEKGKVFAKSLDELAAVKALRQEGRWQEWDAYSNFSPEERKHRLTSGPLGGSKGLGIQVRRHVLILGRDIAFILEFQQANHSLLSSVFSGTTKRNLPSRSSNSATQSAAGSGRPTVAPWQQRWTRAWAEWHYEVSLPERASRRT
jgi:hypothetical protein